MTTLAEFARWIQAAENKRDFDMACAIYRAEHGPKALKAALATIDEIDMADMAERKANLTSNPKGR
jgi:hypothetical protein